MIDPLTLNSANLLSGLPGTSPLGSSSPPQGVAQTQQFELALASMLSQLMGQVSLGGGEEGESLVGSSSAGSSGMGQMAMPLQLAMSMQNSVPAPVATPPSVADPVPASGPVQGGAGVSIT